MRGSGHGRITSLPVSLKTKWCLPVVLALAASLCFPTVDAAADKIDVYFVWKAQSLFECPAYAPEPARHTTCCYNAQTATLEEDVKPENCVSDPTLIDDFEPYFSILMPEDTDKGALRVCTSAPSTLYVCNRENENELDPSLTTDEGCLCQERCLNWQAGYQTIWPASCRSTIIALEDTWNHVSTQVWHNDVPLKSSQQEPFTGQEMKVTVAVSYGTFELYNRERLGCSAGYETFDGFSVCETVHRFPGTSGAAPPDLALTFKRFRTGGFELSMVGTYAAIETALDDLLYRPRNDQNSVRLRSRTYNPAAARDQPYEEMLVAVSQRPIGGGAWEMRRNMTQFVSIFDVNDPPALRNPVDAYSPPRVCETPGALQPACHFGQFFSYEDTDRSVSISGVEIADLDVGETCSFEQPECNKMDVNVRADKGSISLNTRSRLTFYENTRKGQGFTAFNTPSNNAVRVLYYRVELLELLGPASVVFNFNTQHSANSEFVELTVKDQGFSGYKGLSKLSSIQIDVMVVAVNDAPTITIQQLEYALFEDQAQILQGLSVADTDVNEVIESSLARMIWMSEPRNMVLLNQLQVRVSVIHGVLRLRDTRNLRVINKADTYFLTISRFSFSHDTCRQIEMIDDKDLMTGAIYRDACLIENWGPECRRGTEDTCRCVIYNTCASDGSAVLYLNNTLAKRAGRDAFISNVQQKLEASDKTCGGQPFYPAPNNMTFGVPCTDHTDCAAEVLEPCTPGVNCTCCANASIVCSENADCNEIELNSPCGCMLGGPGAGVCGPFCLDSALTEDCRSDLMSPRLSEDGSVDMRRRFGRQCSYRAPYGPTGDWVIAGSNEPMIRRCQAASYVVKGSRAQRVLDLVAGGQCLSCQSKEIAIAGNIVDVNRALAALQYQTDRDYNRLFRPPEEERDPLTFDIEADNLDVLSLEVQDLGNSGGSAQINNRVSRSVDLRVAAVNDLPVANGPNQVKVMEDIPYHFTNTLFVTDPDFEDYGFNTRIFTVNLSCTHGRLFLNETFLTENAGDIIYRVWSRDLPERRGLHQVDAGSNPSPVFGSGCQMLAQCSDGAYGKSRDQPWGFFESVMYGLAYSPQELGGPSVGCGNCPEDAGNKFLSIDGTFESINRALSVVTYLPDPHFNTRRGRTSNTVTETIVFQVTDNGAIGNDGTAPVLRNERRIRVTVESINDRPLIGQLVQLPRVLRTYDGGNTLDRSVTDDAVIAVNKSMDARCMSIPPSGREYFELCGPTQRRFIDVDEDTQFFITPDVMWITDVDSDEAEGMPADRRYCCDEAGETACTCETQPCMCGTQVCQCVVPDVCDDYNMGGELLVQFSVQHGLLTFINPPGRKLFETNEVEFLTNRTVVDMKNGGEMVPCNPQSACMTNVSVINIRAKKQYIQTGLMQNFLSYRGAPNFYGEDALRVWVSDQGYTDDCYNATLVADESISIRVIGINDPPVITAPSYVLVYQKGFRCYADFPVETNDEGRVRMCFEAGNSSRVPPNDPDPNAMIFLEDMDMDATEYGNMTLTLVIGSSPERHSASGGFYIPNVVTDTATWFTEFENLQGLRTMSIQGRIEDINTMMKDIRYDADPTYQGYVPFVITANDMLNFGECDGDHRCGNLEVCADHREGEGHRPARAGLTTLILDVTVGALGKCSATNCEDCNKEEGCGWCPGACQLGKCMLGTASSPKFESCAKDREGRGYRQCQVPTTDFTVIGVAIGVVLFVTAILVYLFLKWVQRRHGSLLVYMKKKQADFKRAGRRMHIMPPDEANYNQFFTLILCMIIIIIAVSLVATSHPTCIFNHSFFIDKASSIYMTLDNCKVRFLPTREMGEPEKSLEAIKVQIALFSDEKIQLEVETCTSNATFSIANNRDDAVKYIGYYCNIEILVPDRFNIPSTTIVASGENITNVRAGPMDVDSPEFGLDFGPNSFTLMGNFLTARLQNVSAKSITYDVTRGALIGLDLEAQRADFTSVDADMIITSQRDTSVQFWQKSANLVCLTGATGSIYVDNSCERVCEYKNSTGLPIAGAPSTYGAPGDNQPWLCSEAEIQLADGSTGVALDCEEYDPVAAELADTCPVGAKYAKKSLVPQVDGCTDRENCIFDESSRCLCKPGCDMANLDPPGVCDGFGRCCQTICSGHSKADLFALPNLPRCGIEVDAEKYNWCNGTLGQQFKFTSDLGQIAFKVGPEDEPSMSSYEGAAPAEVVESTVDINEADKIILNEKFHPGGQNFPASEWFALRLAGPGTPESSVGEFVWISSIRYLVLEPWILNVVSLGLLAPAKEAVVARIKPAFCPAYSDPTSAMFQDRLVQMRGILLESLQQYPPTQREKPIPTQSEITFVPVEGQPRVFKTDPTTNQIGVSLVDPFDYVLVVAIAGLAIGIPVLTAVVTTCLCFKAGNQALKQYRSQKLKQEQLTMNMNQVFVNKDDDLADELKVTSEMNLEMTGRTGFFYMVEEFLGSAESQRTLFLQFKLVVIEVTMAIAPVIVIYIIAAQITSAYRASKCEFRPDVCRCLSEVDGVLQIPIILTVLIYIYFWVAMLEIGLYYLAVPYTLPRRILRHVFYFLFFLMAAMGIVGVLVVVLFIFLGILIKPTHLTPYGIALIGIVACCASFYAKLVKFQTRVQRAVRKRVAAEKGKIKDVPIQLLDVLIDKNIEQAMSHQGLSIPAIIIQVFIFAVFLSLIFIFLFVGFNAFTDPNSMISGFINSFICILVAFAAQQTVAKDGDDEDVKDQVEEMTDKIMRTLQRVLKMVKSQIELAMRLFQEMKKDAHGGSLGESEMQPHGAIEDAKSEVSSST